MVVEEALAQALCHGESTPCAAPPTNIVSCDGATGQEDQCKECNEAAEVSTHQPLW